MPWNPSFLPSFFLPFFPSFHRFSFSRISGVGIVNIFFGSLSEDRGKPDNGSLLRTLLGRVFLSVLIHATWLVSVPWREGGAPGTPGTGCVSELPSTVLLHTAGLPLQKQTFKLVGHSCKCFPGNGSSFLINLMILVSNLITSAYVQFCFIAF